MVRDLRRRCPWDRVQTRETIRPYLIEEVFELDHAIADGNPAAIREEVADLLLHLGLAAGLRRGDGVSSPLRMSRTTSSGRCAAATRTCSISDRRSVGDA